MRVPCREIRLQLCETLVQFFCAAHPKQRDVDERKFNNDTQHRVLKTYAK